MLSYLLLYVSIPSSSGHQFTGWMGTRWMGPVRARVSIPSSSGHQFTGSEQLPWIWPSFGVRFNPFFIRASVYWPFRYCVRRNGLRPFQSLLHQGISLLSELDNVQRAVERAEAFQSLLHQGISLLGVGKAQHRRWQLGSVSIPSSSGHQFTARLRAGNAPAKVLVSIPSSSGHQFTGISTSKCLTGSFRMVSIPSSSGHQFTAGCRCAPRWFSALRFNPFFIRASVYCSSASRRPTQRR